MCLNWRDLKFSEQNWSLCFCSHWVYIGRIRKRVELYCINWFQHWYMPSSPVGYIGPIILGKSFDNINNFWNTARKKSLKIFKDVLVRAIKGLGIWVGILVISITNICRMFKQCILILDHVLSNVFLPKKSLSFYLWN